MIKIAISSEYRLPGVYSKEGESLRLNTTVGGNATVAFVGPSIGSRQASQQITLTGTEPVAFNNSGLVGSPVVKGRVNNVTYQEGIDYTLTTVNDNYTSIARNIRKTSIDMTVVSGQQFTFYAAQPVVDILVDEQGQKIEGHIIKGTVNLIGVDTGSGAVQYAEGVDYAINYYDNTFTTVVGGALADENDIVLAISYNWTTAEPIELLGEGSFPLEHKYVSKDALITEDTSYAHTLTIVSCRTDEYEYGDTPNVVDPYGDTDFIGYIEGIDYVVDYTTGKVARTPESRIPSFDDDEQNYMYAAYGYCAIRSNEAIIVNYRYVDDTYNQATYFDSYNDLIAMYGNPWNTQTGVLESPISMMAYIAARNGLSDCYGVSVQGATIGEDGSIVYTLDSWTKAFEALTVVDGIDIVVPASNDPAVWDICGRHLLEMKDNQDERVAILGADGSEDPISANQMIAYAQSLGREDMWLISPSSFNFRNPITGVVEAVPGYYAAAAVAGYQSSVPQYTPLTGKVISAFFSAKEFNTKIVKTNESGNGLMYIDEVSGALRVLHGVSTSTDSILTRETNIVLTKYYIIKTMRNLFANGYIGSIITPRTLASVQSTVEGALQDLIEDNYIGAYDGVSVEQNGLNPTQIDVFFSYVPMYSLNYIEIEFSVMAGTE